jgi:hypothetical protein
VTHCSQAWHPQGLLSWRLQNKVPDLLWEVWQGSLCWPLQGIPCWYPVLNLRCYIFGNRILDPWTVDPCNILSQYSCSHCFGTKKYSRGIKCCRDEMFRDHI